MKVNCTSLLAATAAAAIASFSAAQCPNPAHDCCTTGTPGCCDAACCNIVCTADPFCCNSSWDSLCVGAAQTNCSPSCGEACGGGGGSNCCFANGGLGCDDPTCQSLICGADPFCCETAWDSICANAALTQCEVCSSGPSACPGDGDCCIANGTPGCADETCCNAVCAADPFCCDTAWDQLCANAAVGLCGCVLTCPVSDHDCYTAGGPGCTDADCCALVCGIDAFCCQTAWDGICVSEAFSLCGVPKCPFECTGTNEGEPCGEDLNGGCNTPPSGNSNCCVGWGGIGCDDQACQDTVCAFDPFCCDTAWDGICASEALSLCGDLCAFVPAFGNISCGETICGTAWAVGGTRDTDWYIFDVGPTPRRVIVTIRGQLPMVAGLINSTDCATASSLNPFIASPYCGEASFEWCFPAGVSWLFAGPNGFEGFPCDSGANGYELTVECLEECTPLGCGSAGHDCYTEGGPYCDDADCCNLVCGFDAFCCATAWDAICVNEAIQFCGAPKCPFECTGTSEGEPCGEDLNGGCNTPPSGDSNCCIANGGLGCDDQTCQDTVCAVDPFCCETAWDGICANEAVQLCGDLCEATTNFGSISCNETICGEAWATGGTRDTDWFILNLAAETTITVTISGQLPMVAGIVNSTDCATATQLIPFVTSLLCGSASFEVTLPAGEHWVFAGPNGFEGFPCGSGLNQYSLTVSCPQTCVAGPDRNGDGCVNGADLAAVLGNWTVGGLNPYNAFGDANCDGAVNGADLAIVTGNWLQGCP